jgi:hypothetical protein
MLAVAPELAAPTTAAPRPRWRAAWRPGPCTGASLRRLSAEGGHFLGLGLPMALGLRQAGHGSRLLVPFRGSSTLHASGWLLAEIPDHVLAGALAAAAEDCWCSWPGSAAPSLIAPRLGPS